MTRPQIYLTRMAVFLGIVAALVALLLGIETMERAFMFNPWLNGTIVGVLVLGIAYIFRQVLSLYPEVRWIEAFRRNQPGLSVQTPPGCCRRWRRCWANARAG